MEAKCSSGCYLQSLYLTIPEQLLLSYYIDKVYQWSFRVVISTAINHVFCRGVQYKEIQKFQEIFLPVVLELAYPHNVGSPESTLWPQSPTSGRWTPDMVRMQRDPEVNPLQYPDEEWRFMLVFFFFCACLKEMS